MSKTNLFDVQSLTYQLEKKFGWHKQSPLLGLTLLSEEVGEVAREVRRQEEGRHGHDESMTADEQKSKMSEEIGDTLFALTKLANIYGINLETAFYDTLAKIEERQNK